MAFGKGKESNGANGSFKKYIGIGMFEIAAINPTAKELTELFGREQTQEPVYVQDKDDHKVATVSVYLRNVSEAVNSNFIVKVNFRLENIVRRGKETGTVKVIDKYGNCRWIPEENYKNRTVPTDNNGNKVLLDEGYRACCGDEDLLIALLRAYMVYDRVDEYVNGIWVFKSKDKLVDLESSLEKIRDYFNGDFSELREIIAMQPHNKFQALLGVRTADDGKEYQDVFKHAFMQYWENKTNNLEYQLDRNKAYSYPNTRFEIAPIHEFTTVITPTDLTAGVVDVATDNPDDDLPF